MEQLGNYKVTGKLGEGGMGVVYRAFDNKLEREVALKVLHSHMTDEIFIKRFRSEARISASLQHPHIVHTYDAGEMDGVCFIAMELLSGIPLDKMLMEEGSLDCKYCAKRMIEISEALNKAHGKGLIHRDLKPSNIFISEDGYAILTDFGIAKSINSSGLTQMGEAIGTPEYMSPEQINGEEIDARSDVYSLGIVMYNLTTGRLPFVGDSPFATAAKHLSEAPVPPMNLNPNITPDFQDIILGCMEKDRNSRPQSMMVIKNMLENLLSMLATGSQITPQTPVPTPYPQSLTCRNCGAVSPPDTQFCGECGQNALAPTPVSGQQYSPPSQRNEELAAFVDSGKKALTSGLSFLKKVGKDITESHQRKIICPNCRTPNNPTQMQCVSCGMQFQQQQYQNPQFQQNPVVMTTPPQQPIQSQTPMPLVQQQPQMQPPSGSDVNTNQNTTPSEQTPEQPETPQSGTSGTVILSKDQEKAAFCDNCGTAISKPDQMFCNKCGSKIN